MKPVNSFLSLKTSGVCLLVILTLPFLFARTVSAQAPPVPTTYQDLYTELDNYLVNFNPTLTPASPPYPTLTAAALKTADSNIGPAMLGSEPGMILQLNELKAMGVQAIMLQIGFPMLYEPFMASQNATYQTQFSNYYVQVVNAIRAAGLKVIIENDTLLVNDVQSGWDVAPFYATLNWTQYQQARAQDAVTIAQLLNPDYLVLVEEPTTEANDSGQAVANTPEGSYQLLSAMVTALQQANVTGIQLGAGIGTWENDALAYIDLYMTLPINFIDFHIYQINLDNLPTAVQIVNTATANGFPVAMSECWLSKVRDSELGVLTDDQLRARNPFSFWAPLDAYFIQTIQNLAGSTQMLFQVPFDSQYFFNYIPYDDSTESLSPGSMLSQENADVQAANLVAQYTSTGMSYYNSLVAPPDTTPPSAPTGLAGGSANPTGTSLSWNAATDNVGVAGYYILRDGQNVATTTTLYYQDSGLTEATTYTYTIEAFDLAGNISAPSAPVSIQTDNVTPPTMPGNVATKAIACTAATLTWSPSTGNVGVSKYLLWMGLTPNSLVQVATAGSSVSKYTDVTLSTATTYYFGVQAEDKDGNISNMSAIMPVTTPALPVAPATVTATPKSGTEISVTWSASTGGLAISHYMVYRGTSPASLSQVATLTGTAYTDMSVTAGTMYYYAIQAADNGTPPSQSGLSTPVSVTTYLPPSAPANVTVTPSSCSNVTVTWSAAVSGGLPIANYRVYKGSSPENLTQLAVAPGTKTSYTDTTDSAQTTYYYAVQAVDTGKPPDVSANSPAVAVTTFGGPSVPANLTVTPSSSSELKVTWSAAISGGLPISTYHVYGGTSPSNMSQLVVTKNTYFNNVSLTPGTTYYYAVQAFDTGGDSSATSNSVSAATLPLPTVPANVAAQGMSSTEIAVSWSPSSGTLPIGHYFVFRGTSPSGMSQIATTSATTFNDRSAASGTTYYYSIQADDTAGDRSGVSPAVKGATQ